MSAPPPVVLLAELAEALRFAALWRETARRALRVRSRALAETDPARLVALEETVARVEALAETWERAADEARDPRGERARCAAALRRALRPDGPA